jgi:hypothetical protein
VSRAEDEFWAGKILEARRNQLDTVRRAATGWSAVFTGILGLFGTVTFVGGLNGLNDLAANTQQFVRLGIALAASCTLVATVLAALAANAFPTVSNDLTVDTFQTQNKQRARAALTQLRVAVVFGVAAASVVLVGSIVVLFAGKSDATPQVPTVIAVLQGKAYCGKVEADGGDLTVAGMSLESVTSLTVVSSCP